MPQLFRKKILSVAAPLVLLLGGGGQVAAAAAGGRGGLDPFVGYFQNEYPRVGAEVIRADMESYLAENPHDEGGTLDQLLTASAFQEVLAKWLTLEMSEREVQNARSAARIAQEARANPQDYDLASYRRKEKMFLLGQDFPYLSESLLADFCAAADLRDDIGLNTDTEENANRWHEWVRSRIVELLGTRSADDDEVAGKERQEARARANAYPDHQHSNSNNSRSTRSRSRSPFLNRRARGEEADREAGRGRAGSSGDRAGGASSSSSSMPPAPGPAPARPTAASSSLASIMPKPGAADTSIAETWQAVVNEATHRAVLLSDFVSSRRVDKRNPPVEVLQAMCWFLGIDYDALPKAHRLTPSRASRAEGEASGYKKTLREKYLHANRMWHPDSMGKNRSHRASVRADEEDENKRREAFALVGKNIQVAYDALKTFLDLQ